MEMGPAGRGDATDTPANQSLSVDGDSIKVYVRVRPLEKSPGLCCAGDQGLCLTVTSPNTIRFCSKPEPKVFTYDHVADMDTTQEAVFSAVGRGIIESCMNGYNGTIFAYGQTGSGKTFTMLGPSEETDNRTHNLRGIIPRSLEYLFYLINREKEKAGEGKRFLCKCSFIEIYNEQIFDLLDPASSGLFLRENIKTGVFVEGVIEQVVTSAAEAYQVLSVGWRNRSVASTSMNRESSRSHAVFALAIESKEKTSALVNIRTSRLNLVDLAGSERQKDSQAEGQRLKEASNINRSLSCLGHVIMGLGDMANGKSRHISYRDSKLTFLLRDSLGGNAKTYIIANVHPGSKCFGETLSTLQFARRAKLIKNKAVINEDTQGNVQHLQAEIKKLKEQICELSKGQILQEVEPRPDAEPVNGHGVDGGDWKDRFLQAMLLWETSESQNQTLKEKVGQLKDVCGKKEKIIQSTRMIVKFRETNIAHLEKMVNGCHANLSPDDKDTVIRELKDEIQILKEQILPDLLNTSGTKTRCWENSTGQAAFADGMFRMTFRIEQDSRVVSYAIENRALREENKYLSSLEHVKQAKELNLRRAAELERAFLEASTLEKNAGVRALYPSPVKIENVSAVSQQRLKARLVQAQNDWASVKQEFEEFQDLTKKKQMELESEVQTLAKANQHLENILEATKAHKRQEVLQLNKMHVETIKNMTTPTKSAWNVALQTSPEGTPGVCAELEAGGQNGAVMNESLPLDMNEQAHEAIAEELRLVQEQLTDLQTRLDEEESKNVKLQQNIDKLENHSTKLNKLLTSERNDRNKSQQDLQTQNKSLENELQDCLSQNNILQSEVQDLRIVLRSADKELRAVKEEYHSCKAQHDVELFHTSDQFIKVQLELDNIRLEHERILEQKRSLQDINDNLLEVMRFKEYEADQLREHLQQMKEEVATLQSEISSLMEPPEAEKELSQTLASQLQQDIENNSKELVKALNEKDLLKTETSELLLKSEQQALELRRMEQSLADTKLLLSDVEKKHAAEQDVVGELKNQIHEMRNACRQKSENVSALTQELEDIKLQYSAAVAVKEDNKAMVENKEQDVVEMREAVESMKHSCNVQMDMLYEDLTTISQHLEQQTEHSRELTAKLQLMQDEAENRVKTIEHLHSQLQTKDGEIRALKCESEGNGHPGESWRQTPTNMQTPRSQVSPVHPLHTPEMRQRPGEGMAFHASMEVLEEMERERASRNKQLQQLQSQLHESKSQLLEMKALERRCRELERCLERAENSATTEPQHLSDLEKKLIEESDVKEVLAEKLSRTETELTVNKTSLDCLQLDVTKCQEELERTRRLEVKAFSEKEEFRSALESANEERERHLWEVKTLRSQVDNLTEENGKLVGHTNLHQKIQYLVKVKKDNSRLLEENNLLKLENLKLKEHTRFDLNDTFQLPATDGASTEQDTNVQQ